MNTLFTGQNSIHLVVVDSTNSYASELLRHNKPVEGTLIYSFDQQKGRGQRGSSWESVPNKNVALSLIFYPGFLPADKQFMLTKMASLAVADLMAEKLGNKVDIRIKWPNDIYAGGKKIAGILIENGLRESMIQNCIIGVGLNVNQTDFITTENATSLVLLGGKEFGLKECIERFCELIEARYLLLKTGNFENTDKIYLERLYQKDELCSYKSAEESFEGYIRGVDTSGKLLIEKRSGELKAFDLKEIIFC